MSHEPSIIERAFQLARGGTCRTIEDIRRALGKEGFAAAASHVSGPSLIKQLKAEMVKRKPVEKPAGV